jgi:2-keto-4-pentenoate hydratase/2-oxohepta-3-ene-1,7-dioic acid hydratase in catechol pathway
MRLVSLRRHAPGSGAGIVLGTDILDLAACGAVIPAARAVPLTVRGILEGGDDLIDLLRRIGDRAGRDADRLRESDALIPLAGAKLAAPVPDPGIILSGGLNYHAHLKEMNTPVAARPYAFAKSVGAIIGPEAAIVLPPSAPDMVDWEGEFSAVIGRRCHNVSAAEALDYVAGYTLINDVSARDWVAPIFQATGTMGPILAWERNVLGKQYPTFCPLGPCVVTRDELPDPNHVQLTTRLNGEVMQSANTSDLVFDVAHVIAHFSQFYRFLPGDVISTGSPAGVGFGRTPPVFMRPGDLIEVHAEGIGALYNPIEAE